MYSADMFVKDVDKPLDKIRKEENYKISIPSIYNYTGLLPKYEYDFFNEKVKTPIKENKNFEDTNVFSKVLKKWSKLTPFKDTGAAYSNGYKNGYKDGYADARVKEYKEAYDEGYAAGKLAAKAHL